MTDTDDVAELARIHGLAPLPAEGGLFRRTWAGPPRPDGRPAGSAILLLLAADARLYSSLHRLPIDEVWHFYRGDPLELLLLEPDGPGRVEVLGGPALDATVQLVVPAGVWMGARVADGGRWSLVGTTMAPGFVEQDYEGADPDVLAAAHPALAERIRELCRPGAPRRMAGGDGGGDGHA